MEMNREQKLPASLQDAWTALNDVKVLQECISGCESLAPASDGGFDLLIVAAVGPVKAKFKGKLRLADMNAPDGYTLHFEVQGGMAGHVKGFARVALASHGPNETDLRYHAQASVGGKIAQVGSRLVDMAAQKLASDFFRAFQKHLQEMKATVGS